MSSPTTTRARPPMLPGAEAVVTASNAVLSAFDRRYGDGADAADPATVVLAALVYGSPHADAPAVAAADRALAGWLAELPTGCRHLGLHAGGLAGCHLGLRIVSAYRPGPQRLVAATRRLLLRRCANAPWRMADVDWSDYDLVVGPAGTLLAVAGDQDVQYAELEPIVEHLLALCEGDSLDRFRIRRYHGEELSGWTFNRVNNGVAHGLPGVALALCALADAYGPRERVVAALRSIGDWLVAEAQVDTRGVVTWLPAAREGNAPATEPVLRQAWCYGTPGVAWALWELGRVLRDDRMRQLAVTAFASFLAHGAVNTNVSRREGLALCHGDAGLLVLCDAFHRHAGLESAGHHRDLLDGRLRGRLADLPQWALENRTLMTGPAGVLAALLTVRDGDRSWLPAMGVR